MLAYRVMPKSDPIVSSRKVSRMNLIQMPDRMGPDSEQQERSDLSLWEPQIV